MNKKLLPVLLIALLGCQIAQARTARTVSVALAFSTNQNSKGAYALSIKGLDVFLDGDKLTTAEVARYQPYLTEVMTILGQRANDPTCAAGKFSHWVVRDGKTAEEKGCLDDDRFHALRTAFEEMRNGRSVAGSH